jgi:hypothetical protein
MPTTIATVSPDANVVRPQGKILAIMNDPDLRRDLRRTWAPGRDRPYGFLSAFG